MKHLVLVGDGMADYPLTDHNGQTPLEIARTPAIDDVVRRGLTGLLNPIPPGMPPGSAVGNLSLFGYDPHATFTGRAPIEAAHRGIIINANQVAFRCNLVTLTDGILESFTADHISTAEAEPLIAALNSALTASCAVSFHTGVSYRHLTIVRDAHAPGHPFDRLTCTPPHDITGQPYAPHLPKGPGEAFARDLINRSQSVLADHPVNAKRVAAGKIPANSIWLWGQGQTPAMESYQQRFGLQGAVISAVDLVNGIGECAGLESIAVPGATGYLDTDYEGKVRAALDALARTDFVYLHVEAPDETSHQGSLDLKIRAIEDFDTRVVAPCLHHILARGDSRLLITPDHVTALSTRTHAAGPVPFALCGFGVEPDSRASYSERQAMQTGLSVSEGHMLVPHLLHSPLVGPDTLKQRF